MAPSLPIIIIILHAVLINATEHTQQQQQQQRHNTTQHKQHKIDNTMKLFSQLVVVLSSVVGTVWVAAEPCANGDANSAKGDGNLGQYDMVACNLCAESGKGQGSCCNAIYSHSLGRDDDDWQGKEAIDNCSDLNGVCSESPKGQCYPGLFCNAAKKCQLQEDNPDACLGGGCASLTRSSLTSTTTKGGPSFVVVVVGLLGAAMLMAMTVVLQRRHRGLFFRRHHYSAVDATPSQV